MKNFKLFKEGKTDINDLKKKYLEFVIKNVFEPNMDDYLSAKEESDEPPYIGTYLLNNEKYGYMIKAVYDIDRNGYVDKDHFLYQAGFFAEEEYYLEDDVENDMEDYEYTAFIEDYSDIIQTITMEQYINSIKQTNDALIKLNENSSDIEKVKQAFYEFTYPMLESDLNDFNEDIEYYRHQLYKINGIYTLVREVNYDQEIDYIVFIYDEKEGTFKNSNFVSKEEEKSFSDHVDEVRDLMGDEDNDKNVIATIDIFDWEKIVKERNKIFSKLNESHDDMIKNYLQKIEEKYKEIEKDDDIIDQQNILCLVEHNGRKFYMGKETVMYKTHSIAFKSIYVKELDRFLWQADFLQKQKNLSTVDKTTYLSALTSEHRNRNVDEIFKITLSDWIKLKEEREVGFVKLNEEKMSQDIERAYIALIDEKFRETKSVFLSYQEEDEDDLGAIYAHLYDLTLLNDETYYIILIEDRVGDQGSLVELYSYLYIEEEKDFIEYNAASRIFTDNKHNDKYYKKYNDIMKEVTFDDIYEILHDDPMPKYSTAEGELSHLRTMEMREWLQIEDERNKMFKKINESVSDQDVIKTYIKVVGEATKYKRRQMDKGEGYGLDVEYFLYKKGGFYFLVEAIELGWGVTYEYYIYIDELEHGDIITKDVFREKKWLENLIIDTDEHDESIYELRDALTEFDEQHSSKNLTNTQLIIRKDVKQIKDAIDATTNAFISLNESVDTNKLFITQASKLASEHFEEMSNKREEDKRYVNVKYSLFRYKKDGETYYLFLEDQMYDEVTMNQNRFVYIDEENEFENRDFIVTIILRDNHPRISKEKAKYYDSILSDFNKDTTSNKTNNEFELVIQKDIYEIKDAMDATTAAVVSMNEKRVKTFESFNSNEDIIKKFLGHIAEFLPQGAIMDFYQKAEEPKTLILYLIEVDLEGNKYYLSVIQYESEKDKAWKHSIYDEEKKEFVYYIEYKLNGTTGSDIVKCYETKIESSNIILELDIEQYLELTKQRESMFKKMNESKKYIKGIDTWKN